MADAIYKIDEDGHLVPYQFPASSDGGDGNTASSSNDSEEESTDLMYTRNEEGLGNGKEAVKPPSGDKKEHADPASIGDRQVYKVYYNSIGPVHAGILVLGMMTFAVSLKFPGAYRGDSCLTVSSDEKKLTSG